jgi:coenzyme F420-reducing hydrogenase delta subunit
MNYGQSPEIRVYYCRNCSHAGDIPNALARLGGSAHIAVESVPCSGRIDPRYLLKAFESGTQAVCVLGCPTGECKLMEGNLRTTRRIQAVRQILSEVGLDPESVQIHVPANQAEDTLDAAVGTVARAAGRVGLQPVASGAKDSAARRGVNI